MKDIVGQRFGKLIVIKRVENDKFNRSKWLCKCDRINTNHWTIERAFTQKVRKFNDFK